MAYDIEGRLLEVCTCNVLCPCWVGEDPDGGTCDSTLAWRVDSGAIEGVDVAGLTLAASVHIPGNVLTPASWTAAIFVDERATPEQEQALLKVFTGQLGGAVADLAGLIGEVVSVQRAPITFTVDGGKGRLTVGDVSDADLVPFLGATGRADGPLRDGVLDDPGLAGLRVEVQLLHARRRRREDPGRRRHRQQRPPGPLPLRGLTATDRCSRPAHLRDPRRDRAVLGAALVALVGAGLDQPRGVGELAVRAVPRPRRGRAAPVPVEAALFTAGWVLMIVAMMLPSSIPLVVTFGALVRRRRARGCSSGCCSPATSSRGRRSASAAWVARPRDPRRGRRAAVARRAPAAHHRLDARDRRACGSSARSATAASTSAGARSASSSTAGAARPSGARRSRWASPTARSASAAAGR